MSIQLITFDLDDTLWPVQPVIAQAEQQLQDWLAQQAPHLGVVDVPRLHSLRAAVLRHTPELIHRVSELRYQVLLSACLEAGDALPMAQETAEAAFQVFLSARQNVQLYADAKPVLGQLAQNFVLGALSNGNADVRRVGLGEYFSFALSADALGVSKPDPSVFQAALARAQIPAQRAVHIGDNPHDDIFGAQRVGMRTIWFNPQQQPWQGERAPDAQVQSLSQLPQTLLALQQE